MPDDFDISNKKTFHKIKFIQVCISVCVNFFLFDCENEDNVCKSYSTTELHMCFFQFCKENV